MKYIIALSLLVLCFNSFSQRVYDPSVLIQSQDLSKDSFYIKEGTDSVYRKFPNNVVKFMYRSRQAIYDKAGLVSNMVRFVADTFSIVGATPVISIAHVGFTRVLAVIPAGQTNTSNANDVPMATVKDFNSTSVTLNVVQGASTTIGILGAIAVGFRFLQVPSTTKIHLLVIGY